MSAIRLFIRLSVLAALAVPLSGCLVGAVAGTAIGVTGAAVGMTAKGVGMAAGAIIPDGDDDDDRRER
jgi:hypothetical protein